MSSGRVMQQTRTLMGMELGIRVMDALVSVILARYLAPQGFGLLAFAISFASLFSILPGFGMGSLTMRDLARDREGIPRYFTNGMAAKALLAGLTLLAMSAAAWALRFSPHKCLIVVLAGVLMIVETNVRFTLSFFQAVEQTGVAAVVNLTVRALWVVLSMAVVALRGGILQLLAVRIAGTALGLLAAVLLIHTRLHKIQWRFEPRFMWKMLTASFPFALYRLYGTVYTDIDTVMLSSMRGDLMTGWYAAGQKFIRMINFIPGSFSQALLPAASAASRRSRSDFIRTVTRSCRLLLAIGLTLAVGGFLLAGPVIRLLFGAAYAQAIPSLRIQVWTVPFMFLNAGLVAAVAAVNREKQGSRCLLGGALFSSLSNFVVVPLWGHLGAASTTLMAEALVCGLQLRILRAAAPEFSLLRVREDDAQRPATVMFLETSLRVGGTETVLTHLMRKMDRSRFRPILCCLYGPGALGERLIEEGAQVAHSLGASRWDPRIGPRLLRLMARERVQVLFIVNQPMTQFWGVLCGLLAGVPVRVTAIRATGKINRVRKRLWLNRLTFPWVTRVTALSETHKAYLVEREGIPAEKIAIIPNGVDLDRFQAGQSNGGPVVGIVAMLRPEKNHALFLRAAGGVLRRAPKAQFWIVGDGPERPRLEALAGELGIASRVRFLGARQDVPAVVSRMDVAVLSSHPVVETLSNAVLEYMAASKPVVATRVGSLAEQVEEGRTGFLVEPSDAAGMTERILRLIENPALARQMGQAGREKVERQYTLQRMVSQTEALFEGLLANGGGIS